jgi:hypothetical protein
MGKGLDREKVVIEFQQLNENSVFKKASKSSLAHATSYLMSMRGSSL